MHRKTFFYASPRSRNCMGPLPAFLPRKDTEVGYNFVIFAWESVIPTKNVYLIVLRAWRRSRQYIK